MIFLTRLNGEPLVLNAELIKSVQATPDTTLSLVNNDLFIVRETVEEVVKRAIEYQRRIRAFAT